MLYFKKVNFTNDKEKEITECAFRKFALKRHVSLDIISGSTYDRSEKLFLGNEGTTVLLFTRIRSPFENILPKLIISFPKHDGENFYKLRLSFISTVIFTVLTTAVLFNLFFVLKGDAGAGSFFNILFFYAAYFALILLELNLTQSSIRTAIRKYITIKKLELSNRLPEKF